MGYHLKVYRAALQEAVRQISPETMPSIEFKPCLDLSLGDFYSDVSRDLAEHLKESAAGIAGRLLKILSDNRGPHSWSAAGDYLNLKLSGSVEFPELSKGESGEQSGVPEISIFLPARTAQVSWAGYARVAAHAALQLSLLQTAGLKGAVILPGGAVASPDWIECFRTAALAAEQPCTAAFASLPDLRSQLSGLGRKTLWLYPDSIPRSEFAGLFEAGNTCQALTVERAKLSELDTHILNPARLKLLSRREVAALMLMLGSDRPGVDLDLNSAVLLDRENLPWFIGSIRDRLLALDYHQDRVDAGGRQVDFSSCSEEESELVRRGLQLFAFVRLGALSGEVSSWVNACRDMAIRTSRWLNHPTLRNLAGQRLLPHHQISILAGVCELFSAMMRECQPFLGQEQTRQ